MAVACLLISPQISSETPSCSVPHPYRPRAATPLCGLAAIGTLARPNGRPPSWLQVGVDRLRSAPRSSLRNLTQVTHIVGTRRVTWLPPPWAMAKGVCHPEACV
eukprot:scaffold856_cov45-Phaeocystis_antarctica.AAC.1